MRDFAGVHTALGRPIGEEKGGRVVDETKGCTIFFLSGIPHVNMLRSGCTVWATMSSFFPGFCLEKAGGAG